MEEITLYRITLLRWCRGHYAIRNHVPTVTRRTLCYKETVLRMFDKPFWISRVHCVKCLCVDTIISVTVQSIWWYTESPSYAYEDIMLSSITVLSWWGGYNALQNHCPIVMGRTLWRIESLSVDEDEEIMLYRITLLRWRGGHYATKNHCPTDIR